MRSIGDQRMSEAASHLTIRRIAAEETIDLRHRVLWPALPREVCVLPDDDEGLHAGGFIAGALVCVASIFLNSAGARLRKFATAPEFQRQGIGTAVLRHVVCMAREAGADRLWCDARVDASSLYARIGMSAEGEAFERRGMAFIRMAMPLASQPRSLELPGG